MSVNGFDFDGTIHRYNYNSLDNIPPNIAPAYSASSTYTVGDYCTKDNVLYKCSTAINTAEAWNSAHWTQVQLATDVADLKDDLSDIEDAIAAIVPGLSEEAKEALLACFAHVAWIDDDGQDYYNTLQAALYNLNVTSINASFAQGSNIIFDSDSLDVLRQYLTVTATYENGTSGTVSGYELSGSLSSSTSTITVTYEGKTTTFSVAVTMPVFDYKANRDGKLSNMSGILVDSNDLSKFSESISSGGNLRLEGTQNSASDYLQFKIGNNPSTGNWRMRIKALIYSLSNTDYCGGMRPNISNGSAGLRCGMIPANGTADIIYFEGATGITANADLIIGEPETWYDFELYIDDSVPVQRLKINGNTIFESETFGTAAKNNSVFIVGKCLIFIDTIKLYNA